MELEDSLGLEVRALLEGGAYRDGLGCRGEGGTRPTLVWCQRGAGAAAASAEPTTRPSWAAEGAAAAVGGGTTATVAVVVGGGAAAAAAGPGLDPSAGGGEDCLTSSRKLCPPRVFTMAGLEKERRWRGWEEERF